MEVSNGVLEAGCLEFQKELRVPGAAIDGDVRFSLVRPWSCPDAAMLPQMVAREGDVVICCNVCACSGIQLGRVCQVHY